LIDKGIDVNIGNDHGNTPLHYACYWRHAEIAEVFFFFSINLFVLE